MILPDILAKKKSLLTSSRQLPPANLGQVPDYIITSFPHFYSNFQANVGETRATLN
jgi:hypothetical protein